MSPNPKMHTGKPSLGRLLRRGSGAGRGMRRVAVRCPVEGEFAVTLPSLAYAVLALGGMSSGMAKDGFAPEVNPDGDADSEAAVKAPQDGTRAAVSGSAAEPSGAEGRDSSEDASGGNLNEVGRYAGDADDRDAGAGVDDGDEFADADADEDDLVDSDDDLDGDAEDFELDGPSFAIAATSNGNEWDVRLLPDSAMDSLDGLVSRLRSARNEGPVIGLICVDDDWCAIIRPVPGRVRLLMSDATAALDDYLATDMLDELGVDTPAEEDAVNCDEPWPEGEFDLLEDLGASEQVLSVIFDDEDLYASEQLLRVAEELGFAEELADAADLELE